MKATVFLGGGRITNALLAGLRLAKDHRPIVVHDRNPEKLRELKKLYAVEIESDLQRAVSRAGLLIVAVRPSSVSDLLRNIERPAGPLAAVSLAAGIPIRNLRGDLGAPVRWARAMPSPVCRIGHGLTALTFERSFPKAERPKVEALFGRVGGILEISEGKFDLFTATFSPSHGYHALAALASTSQKLGLDRQTAIAASTHALADAIVAFQLGNVSLEALLHEAATPGGTAAATMEAMDMAGYREAVRKGLVAGVKRAQRNAKVN